MPLPPRTDEGKGRGAATCPYHPGRPAVVRCDGCGRYWCPECIEYQGDLALCPECRAKRATKHKFLIFVSVVGAAVVLGAVGMVAYRLGSFHQVAPSDRMLDSLHHTPEDSGLRIRVARMLITEGKKEEARRLLRWFVHHEEDRRALDAARLLLKVGDTPSSLHIVRHHRRERPGASFLIKLEGKIWLAKGDKQECIRLWKKALHLRPDDIALRLELSEVLASSGRVEEARQILEEGLRYADASPLRAQLEKKLLSLIKGGKR